MDFPMFSMTPFITPFATHYDPNGAAGALAANRNAVYGHEDRQAALAENQRQFNEELPLKQFQTFGNQYNENRRQTEAETEQDTRLLQWIHDVVRQDPQKAQAAAPFLHGILQSRGIDMEWDPQTGDTASTRGATGTSGLAQGQPGESFQDFYGRMAKAAPAGIPKPGSTTEEMIARHQREVGAPEAPPEQPPKPSKKAVQQAMPPPGTPLSQWMGEVANQPTQEAPDTAPPEEVQQEMRQQGQPYGTGQPPPEPAPQPQQQAPQQAAPAQPAPATPTQAPGVSAAPAKARPQAAPKGRWVFRKGGKELGAIDMGALAELDQRQAAAVGKGFNTGVLPAEDKNFVAAAEQTIRESGMNREEAQAFLQNVVQKELDRRQRERTGMAQARSRAQSQPSIAGVSTVHDDIQNIQEHYATRYDVNGLHKRELAAKSAEELVKSGNPMEQRDALTQHLKSMFSSVTSDRELGFATEAAGKLTQIEMKFNAWFAGGELPENYRELLAEANSIIQEQTRAELERVGTAAHDYVMRDNTLSLDKAGRTQIAGVVKGYFTGKFDVPEVEGPSGVPGMKGGGGSVRTSESKKGGHLSEEPVPAKTKQVIDDLKRYAK